MTPKKAAEKTGIPLPTIYQQIHRGIGIGKIFEMRKKGWFAYANDVKRYKPVKFDKVKRRIKVGLTEDLCSRLDKSKGKCTDAEFLKMLISKHL